MKTTYLNTTKSAKVIDNERGDLILWSYKTPVALIPNGVGHRSLEKYSVTTTKHTNKFLCRYAKERVGMALDPKILLAYSESIK